MIYFQKKSSFLCFELLVLSHIYPGYELKYRDLGNTIHFLFLMTQFFPHIQKITIPKYDKFLFLLSEKQKQLFFAVVIKNDNNMRMSFFVKNSFVVAARARELS